MTSSFKDKIRKNKIKQPTRYGFSLDEWNKEWSKEDDKAGDNAEIYLAGLILYSILDEIRDELQGLYSKAPNISNEKLIMIYFSLSNRDRDIISKFSEKYASEVSNLFSATLSNGIIGNELTLQEVADNCVDGLEKAIFNCINRIGKGEKAIGSSSPIDVMEFVSREAGLSQLYGIYESYWHALLWGEYQLLEIDRPNKVYAIAQKNTGLEVSATYSQIRKQKLAAQSGAISGMSQITKLYSTDRYIRVSKDGRRKKLIAKTMVSAPQEIVYMNSAWRSSERFLVDEFPDNFLNKINDNGFSIVEALNVFRCLVLLSCQLTNEYPDDDSAYNIKKLLQFCPKLGKLELKKGLEKATNYSFIKISTILNFIEYSGEKEEDLWCNPIIEVNGSEYALLTSSLITPSITRVVEHWLVKLKIDMSDKGETYENTVIDSINSAISGNKFIDDFDKGICRRIKLNSAEEEIDLLVRIDDVLILGEAKSIVTTDSPISQYRALETLRYAAEQVNRKSEFLRSNIEEIFSYLGWKFDKSKSCDIVNCIINSGRMYVGSGIDGIPVVDEKILTKYFSSTIVPYISRIHDNMESDTHLAWFELYSDIQSLKNNINIYLNNPPQINNDKEDFYHKTMKLPCVTDESFKIAYSRLVPKDISPKDRLNKQHIFPLRTIRNIDEELSKMSVTF